MMIVHEIASSSFHFSNLFMDNKIVILDIFTFYCLKTMRGAQTFALNRMKSGQCFIRLLFHFRYFWSRASDTHEQ